MSESILAIEWSSSRLSVGWRIAGQLYEEVLTLKRFQAEFALPALEKVVGDLTQVKEIRVGRGPGNYSGIRQALAWAFGYTAPGGIALKVLSSGVAQGGRISKCVDVPFAILGDARRGVWWGRVFGMDGEGWRVMPPEAWAEDVAGMQVFSQEASRLAKAPFEVKEDFPSALDLLNVPAEVLWEAAEPLYLHPAV